MGNGLAGYGFFRAGELCCGATALLLGLGLATAFRIRAGEKMVAGYCWRAPGEGELATYAEA